MTRRMVGVPAALAAGLAIVPAQAATIYSNNFEAPAVGASPGAGWSANTEVDSTPTGRKFLGGTNDSGGADRGLGAETATFALGGISSHTTVTVDFDLFVIGSWDGAANSAFAGPDQFLFRSDGTTRLDTTFSNVDEFGFVQNYPDASGGSTSPAYTGSSERDSLGYGGFGDAVYHFAFSFAHSGASLTLDWLGQGLQDLIDESWGLDNLVITADVAPPCTSNCGPVQTPEPASLALLGLGLAGFAALRRRRT